jgi:hypothetical protein
MKLTDANNASFRDPKLPPLALDEEERLEQERLRKIRAKRNDVKDIRNLKMLERIDLDFDSPRMSKAMDDLGVTPEECQKKERSDFEIRGVNEDVVDLRFKHYQHRLIDTLNRVIGLRRDIKDDERKKE